jgi:hypothetical protein
MLDRPGITRPQRLVYFYVRHLILFVKLLAFCDSHGQTYTLNVCGIHFKKGYPSLFLMPLHQAKQNGQKHTPKRPKMNSRMLQHLLGKPGHHRRRINEVHLNLSKHIPVPLPGRIPSKARGHRPVQSSCVHNL